MTAFCPTHGPLLLAEPDPLATHHSRGSDRLADRVGSCPCCQAAFDEMVHPLAEAMRQGSRQPTQVAETETVRDLIATFKRMARSEDSSATLQGDTCAEDLPAQGSEGGPERKPLPPSLAGILAPPVVPDELGRLGKYRVLSELGRGGMGIVFRARDAVLDRPVALKVMRPERAESPQLRQRFLREARAVGRLEHENVVPVWDANEENGVLFFAMPLLQGENLALRLRREGALPLDLVYRIGIDAAEGLAAAHACGLIHRDIKPANLWLEHRVSGVEADPGGEGTIHELPAGKQRLRILDFGLAAVDEEAGLLTQPRDVLGTPYYMSPEQATGKDLDVRTDLFSLGCVLYQAATGKRTVPDGSLHVVLRAVEEQVPPAPHLLDPRIPRALSDYIMRLLAKDPAQRPRSALEVARTLRDLREGKSARIIPVVPAGKGKKDRPPRSPAVAVACALLALAAALASVILIIRTPQGEFKFECPDGARLEVEVAEGATLKVIPHERKNPPPDREVEPPPEARRLPPPKILKVEKFGQGSGGLTLPEGSQASKMVEVGDLDGNGAPDLALGAPGDAIKGRNSGAVHLLFRKPDGTFLRTKTLRSGDGGLQLPAEAQFGGSLAAPGDLNGDGVPDLLVGAFEDDGGAGSLLLLFLAADGSVKNVVKYGRKEDGLPLGSNDRFGFAVADLGDRLGDKGRVLAVGATGTDEGRGAVYLLQLDGQHRLKDFVKVEHGRQGLILETWTRFGSGLAPLDLRKDGSFRLAVGAFGEGDPKGHGNGRGAVYMLSFGPDLKPIAGFTRITEGAGGFRTGMPRGNGFGYALANIGDFDGDGNEDLAVSAVDEQTLAPRMRGAVYLLNLRPDPTTKSIRVKSFSRFGHDDPRGQLPPGQDVEFGNSLAVLTPPAKGVLRLAVGGGPEFLGGRHKGSVYQVDLEMPGKK